MARVGWNFGKIKGYSEADLEGGPLRLAVGLGYKIDLADLSQGTEEAVADNLSHGLQGDALLKVDGLDLQLGVYLMKLKTADVTLGAMAQAGYFIAPKRVQLAARFAFVQTEGDRELLEARGAFNWYFRGHGWKWATDFGVLVETGEDSATMTADEPDVQVRSMVQMTF